jgi:hypothetical protein
VKPRLGTISAAQGMVRHLLAIYDTHETAWVNVLAWRHRPSWPHLAALVRAGYIEAGERLRGHAFFRLTSTGLATARRFEKAHKAGGTP